MPFEEFTLKRRPVMDTPMVSILKQGIIGLNGVCYEKFLKKHKYVIFLYDKESNTIAIKPTNEPSGNTYNIRVSRGGRLANISAIAFLKYYKIPYKDGSKSYTCAWNTKENRLEIELNKK